jgi:hypothetical protein
MKHTVSIVAIVALVILAGCTSSKVAYRSKATLKPADKPDQYDVAFEVSDVSDPANPRVVSTPQLRIIKGKKGSVTVGDQSSGVTCEAVVAASGTPKARTSVSVKQDGEVVWYTSQTMHMSR